MVCLERRLFKALKGGENEGSHPGSNTVVRISVAFSEKKRVPAVPGAAVRMVPSRCALRVTLRVTYKWSG